MSQPVDIQIRLKDVKSQIKALQDELNKLQKSEATNFDKQTKSLTRAKIKSGEELHSKALAQNASLTKAQIAAIDKIHAKALTQNKQLDEANRRRIETATKLETAKQQKILENSKKFATEYAKTKGVADISTTALGEGTIQSYKMSADGKFTQTLKTANGEIIKYKGYVDKTTGSLKIMSSETAKVNKEVKVQEGLFTRLGSTMVKNTAKFAEWIVSGTIIMQTLNTIKSAIKETVAMDTAMTGLAKVSGESKDNLESYKSTVYETAKSMGALTTDVVDATAVFARAGYTLSESGDLGKSAILLSNVADSFQDVSTSGEQIISILKGFGLESNRAFDVVDKLNELSNKYNVTNTDLSMGLQRSAAVMNAFGNDIDETNAMLTGSIEVLGNWEKSSRGLNTIGGRLRGLTEDGEKDGEMIATLDKLFNEFGLTLMKSDGTFKSTFDIINELASVQDTLGKQDPNKFQYLLEKISGRDQLPVLQSLLANIDAMNSALEASKNAYGSAEEEQARYLESIDGRLKTTKASIQEFYQSFATTDTIKTAVTEFGKFIEVLTAINESIGLIPIAFGIATASIALFNKELIFTSGVAMVNLIKDLPLIIASVRQFGLAALFAANGIGLMHAAMIPLVAIAGLAIWTIQKVAEEEKYFAEQAENATKFSQNQTQAFKDNKASADELINSLSDLANAKSLTVEQDKRVEEITAQISKMYPDLLSNMDKEGNKLVNLVNAYNAVTKAALQSQVARLSSETVNLEDQLAKERNPVTNDKWGIRSAIAQQGGIETAKTKILDTQITARKDALRKAMDELESFKGITIDDLKSSSPPPKTSGGTSGGTSATKDKTDQFASYKNAIEDVNHALTILSSKESIAISDPDKIKILTEQNEKYSELQQRVHEYADALREEQKGYSANSDEYRELEVEIQKQSEAWWSNEAAIKANIQKIQDFGDKALDELEKKIAPALTKISDILEETQDKFESDIDKRIDSYEAELDALKKKQQALEQEEERLKIIKDLEEARLKLRNIQNEKNVQLYTGQGATGWEWVADPAQLESAGEAVADLEEKLREFDLDATRQAGQDKLQAKIDALEAQKQAEQQKYNERKQKFDDFENYIKTQMEANDDIKLENLNDFLSNLTEDEIASYGTRIEELRKFVASWNAQVAQMKMLGATGGGSYGSGGSSSGSKTVLVGPDGKAPPGLSAGDRVMTGGGTYRIDKVKSDGSYESTKVDNQRASQPTGKAVGGPVSAGQTYEVNELGLEAMMTKRNGRDYLTPLTSGKILTASQTKSALAGVGGGNISIGNINLPNVREPEDFMPALIQSIKTFARNS